MAGRTRITDEEALAYHLEPRPGKIEINASTAMATQRAYEYDSDISPLGKAIRPKGWRKTLRKLRRGANEINQAPRQIWQYLTGEARIVPVAFQEKSPDPANDPYLKAANLDG